MHEKEPVFTQFQAVSFHHMTFTDASIFRALESYNKVFRFYGRVQYPSWKLCKRISGWDHRIHVHEIGWKDRAKGSLGFGAKECTAQTLDLRLAYKGSSIPCWKQCYFYHLPIEEVGWQDILITDDVLRTNWYSWIWNTSEVKMFGWLLQLYKVPSSGASQLTVCTSILLDILNFASTILLSQARNQDFQRGVTLWDSSCLMILIII